MTTEKLIKFTSKLKDISAHHETNPDEIGNRLFKELRRLDKGLNLELLVKEKKAQLAAIDSEIAQKQTKAQELTTSTDQLNSNQLKLEVQLAQSRKHITQDIGAINKAAQNAISSIKASLTPSIDESLREVRRLSDEALKVGRELGKLEGDIESYGSVKTLVSLVRGDDGLDNYQLRVIGLTVLRGIYSWLEDKESSPDLTFDSTYLLKNSISSSISELEKWKS